MATLDLSRMDTNPAELAEQSAVLTLKHPITDEPMADADGAVTITLIGADSKTAEQKRRATANKRLKHVGRPSDDPAGQAEKDVCELLATLTRGWTNIADASGPITFSHDAAAKLYRERAWIRRQVDAFVSDVRNFGGDVNGNASGTASGSALGNSSSGSSITPDSSSASTVAPVGAA